MSLCEYYDSRLTISLQGIRVPFGSPANIDTLSPESDAKAFNEYAP